MSLKSRVVSLLFLVTIGLAGAAEASGRVVKCIGFYTQGPPVSMDSSTVYVHNDGTTIMQARVRWYYLNAPSILDPVVDVAPDETKALNAPGGNPETVVAAKVTTSENDVFVDARALHVIVVFPNFTERQVLCADSKADADSLLRLRGR